MASEARRRGSAATEVATGGQRAKDFRQNDAARKLPHYKETTGSDVPRS